MFAAEARGLGWLGEAGALRLPKVVAVAAPEAPQQFLVLELVATGAPARDFDERLGRGLAALHRRGAPGFGLDHDNFIGWLPQANARGRQLARSSIARAGWRRSCAGPPTRGARRRGCGRASSDCSGSSTSSAARPSRPRACTATCGAATCSATIAALHASLTPPSTAVTARSIWP